MSPGLVVGSAELSPWWLRHQCGCAQCRTDSGQRIEHTEPTSDGMALAEVLRHAGGDVELRFADGHRTALTESELTRSVQWRSNPTPFGFSSRQPMTVRRSPWRADPGPEQVREWLEALDGNQVLVLTGAPTRCGVVARTAERFGPVMSTIYGDSWLVRVEDVPDNIAYTARGLPFHQDLCAYETPPGLQLLHCVEFAAEVEGGDSQFCDGLAAAEHVRATAPDDFATLCRVWATFATVNRKQHMMIRKPHIVVDDLGHIVGLNWAPPFEGTFAGAPCDEASYRRAHRTFADAVEKAPRMQLRLHPGDLVVFLNRRTLHGRTAYKHAGAAAPRRVLEGCYVSADDVANRYRRLIRE